MSSPQDRPDKTTPDRAQTYPVGGQLKVLSQASIEAIHDGALHLLETVGLSNATPGGIAAMTARGATLGEDGRIRFPRRLVESVLDGAGRGFTLHGRQPRHDLKLGGGRVHYGTAGSAVQFLEPATGERRESRLADLYDAARIADTLDHVHFFQRPMVARDIADPLAMDINTLYACLSGTAKHVGLSFAAREHVAPALELMHMVAGSEAAFRQRPFVSNSNAFVISPLQFAGEACGVLEACVAGGLPILLLCIGQAGTSAPRSLAGAVTQTIAEVLAGLIYVNSLRPGHPAILGAWPFAADPRSGGVASGSAEQALLSAACAQMARFYDIPGGSGAGMTDAPNLDHQSGAEKSLTEIVAGFSGLDLVYEAAGMQASLSTYSHESLIIDNDIIGQCLRCIEGIAAEPRDLALAQIEAVCLGGPGHFLEDAEAASTFHAPRLASRADATPFEASLIEKAEAEKNRLLARHFPRHIASQTDARIREHFAELIALPREQMGF